MNAVDTVKEDTLFVNVIKHAEKQELLRDPNFSVLKFELEAINDFSKNALHSQFAFKQETVLSVKALNVESLWLVFILSSRGYLYCYQVVFQEAPSNQLQISLSSVAETKLSDDITSPNVSIKVEHKDQAILISMKMGDQLVNTKLKLEFNNTHQKFQICFSNE